MARLYVLGGGGRMPAAKRETSCYLIETRRSVILLDCGTGVVRLADPMFQTVVARAPRAIVLLSHYHHDHVAGLNYLAHFFRDHETTIACPPKAPGGVRGVDMLERLAGDGVSSTPFRTWPSVFRKGLDVVELREGRNRVAGESVEVARQPHSDECVGFRVRDVAFVTDTTARPETASFAKGVAALVHDARLDEESADGPDRGSHATATGAAMVARDAEAGTLVLAHLDPSFDEARLERMRFEACKVFPKTHLANDFATFELKTIESDDGAAESRAPAETAAED